VALEEVDDLLLVPGLLHLLPLLLLPLSLLPLSLLPLSLLPLRREEVGFSVGSVAG
jgi:hypothetical protein